MKLIPLSKKGKNKGKYFAVVNDEDYDLCMQWNWSVEVCINTQYAMRVTKEKEKIYMTRFLLGLKRGNVLTGEHRDGNGLNNQRNNIREATQSENRKNKINPYGSSKYLGVNANPAYRKKKMFIAKIVINKKQKHLGSFENEIDAAKCYNENAKKYHGEFARLNKF